MQHGRIVSNHHSVPRGSFEAASSEASWSAPGRVVGLCFRGRAVVWLCPSGSGRLCCEREATILSDILKGQRENGLMLHAPCHHAELPCLSAGGHMVLSGPVLATNPKACRATLRGWVRWASAIQLASSRCSKTRLKVSPPLPCHRVPKQP